MSVSLASPLRVGALKDGVKAGRECMATARPMRASSVKAIICMAYLAVATIRKVRGYTEPTIRLGDSASKELIR
jgi:hypothetical protein